MSTPSPTPGPDPATATAPGAQPTAPAPAPTAGTAPGEGSYLAHNLHHWNVSTEVHWGSPFYNVEGWLAGSYESLRAPELALLPDELEGLKALHLQCHFGQDTLSLARRGAAVTGIDLSDRAIARAGELAKLAGLEAQSRFVACDVYETLERLPAEEAGTFDLVFSTYGTIGWLPDLTRWARVVAGALRPGASFVFAEFHPMVWMLSQDRSSFEWSYFNRGPIAEESTCTYADSAATEPTVEVGFNHPIGDVLGALLAAGLVLEHFEELDYSPWACFHDAVKAGAAGEERYHLKGLEGKLPLTYTLRARKPAAQ